LGHQGNIKDDNGNEKDGFDETLVPVDYGTKGQIRDDDIFSTLVGPMPAGVGVTSIMDCCHSGTVLDLLYVFIADGEHEGMEIPAEFDFATLQNLFESFMKQDGVQEAVEQCCAILKEKKS
jgi:hypothetical protein